MCELSPCWQNSKAIGFEYVFSKMRIFCGTFLKRLGWANWICRCVIGAIIVILPGRGLKVKSIRGFARSLSLL